MSDFTAIAVMLALILLSYGVYFAADRWVNNRSDIIVSGVLSGVSLPTRHRRMLITNSVIPITVSVVAMLAVETFAFAAFARSGGSELVRRFALVCAALYGMGAFGWVAFGAVWIAYLLALVREVEQR